MGFWSWLLVFLGIGLLALGLYGLLGLRLWRKSKELMAEVGRLTETMAAAEDVMRPESTVVGAEPMNAPSGRRRRREPASSEWDAAARQKTAP